MGDLDTRYEAFYRTNVEEDMKLHLSQFESLKTFYLSRGCDVELSNEKRGDYWELHIVVYND